MKRKPGDDGPDLDDVSTGHDLAVRELERLRRMEHAVGRMAKLNRNDPQWLQACGMAVEAWKEDPCQES